MEHWTGFRLLHSNSRVTCCSVAIFAIVIGFVIRGHIAKELRESLDKGIDAATRKIGDALPAAAAAGVGAWASTGGAARPRCAMQRESMRNCAITLLTSETVESVTQFPRSVSPTLAV